MKAITINIANQIFKILTVIFILLFSNMSKATCPVSADFSFLINGNTVTFTPVQTADTLVTFYWDFRDGNFSGNSGVVSNTFINAGNYQVFFSVSGLDLNDTSIHCRKDTFVDILIEDSLPCEHQNKIVTTNLFYPDNNIGVGFCASYKNCLFPNSFTVIGNANHGSINQNGTSCFAYQIESVGIDTLKIISCNANNNCDTTTHIINIQQRNSCNVIAEDTIHLVMSNSQANYCTPFTASGRFFVQNNNSYFPYSFCSPNNLQLIFDSHGIYNITIIDSINNCYENIVFNIIDTTINQNCDTITCLLPGDADHDFTVNNYDVLALGLSYNRTGNVRPNSTTQYSLQACPDWNTMHYYGYDDKFADCNGDGIINSTDALVISQNYIVKEQNIFNHRQSNIDSLPTVYLSFDTLPTMIINGNCDGAELTADINIGTLDEPIIDGYGVAFSVNYPFDNDTCFSVQVDLDPSSWLQTNNPVLLFYKNIPAFKRVDITVVRTDGLARSGNGRIGRIKMITEGGIFRGRLSSSKIFDFSVTDVAAINNIGQQIDILGSEITVNFVTSGIKQNKVDGLKIYPNPTNDKIYINAKENIESVKIIDLSGRIINEISPNNNDIQLDFSTTENGMYIIEIKGKNSVSYEKIFKQ